MIKLFISTAIIFFLGTSLFANPWIKKASFGGVGRHRGLGMSIGNKGYIGLGHVNGTGIDISYKDWWQYDPASDSWTQKANFPVNNHGAVGFGTSTKGYVGGGSALTNEFYAYNPVTNTWSPIAPCPFFPGDTQGFCIQNKGYVYTSNNIAEYDPTTNTWTLKAQAPVNFGSWSCSFASSGSGFIKSGVNLYEFKPNINQWIQRTNFPGLMSNGSSAFNYKGTGIFTSGYSGGLSNVVGEVWQFNPGDNTWKQLEDFPGTNRRFSVAFSINNKGYFGTGTNGINLNDFWQFDITTAGINENSIGQAIQPFPNPSNDELHFVLPEGLAFSEVTLQVFDPMEKNILHANFEGSIMSIKKGQELNSGTYLFRVMKGTDCLKQGKIILY
jgi:N-acetylneuraminic acid mutarotase